MANRCIDTYKSIRALRVLIRGSCSTLPDHLQCPCKLPNSLSNRCHFCPVRLNPCQTNRSPGLAPEQPRTFEFSGYFRVLRGASAYQTSWR